MFDRHHGSIAERGTNPGNWEMARPVETCRICSKVVLIRVCGCFAAVGFLRFMTAGIAAGGAVAGLLLPRGVVVSGGFHVRLLACVTVSQSGVTGVSRDVPHRCGRSDAHETRPGRPLGMPPVTI